MNQITKKVLAGFLISAISFVILPFAYATDITAPLIQHDAPLSIQSPEVTVIITITDDVELASVGFGAETAPLSNIHQDVVSPGLQSVTLTKNLTNLTVGQHDYLVIATDTAGNVTKTRIVITREQEVYSNDTVILKDMVSTGRVDLWTVEFVDVASITVRGPQKTAILNDAQKVIACIGAAGEVSFDPALLGTTPGFGVAISGSASGVGAYEITVTATGTNPSLVPTLVANDYSVFYFQGWFNCP